MKQNLLVAIIIAFVATMGYGANLPTPQIKGYDGEFRINASAEAVHGKTILAGVYIKHSLSPHENQQIGRWIGLVEVNGFWDWLLGRGHDGYHYEWAHVMDVQETYHYFYVTDIQITSDGYLMSWGPSEYDPRITKFNTDGYVASEISVADSLNPNQNGVTIVQGIRTTSDGFLLRGYVGALVSGKSEAFVTKFNQASGLRVEWNELLDVGYTNYCREILDDGNNGKLLILWTATMPPNNPGSGYEESVYLVVLDSKGHSYTPLHLKTDYMLDVLATPVNDKGYIVQVWPNYRNASWREYTLRVSKDGKIF